MVSLEVGWCCYVGQGADHHGCCVVAAAETTSQNDVLIYTAPVVWLFEPGSEQQLERQPMQQRSDY